MWCPYWLLPLLWLTGCQFLPSPTNDLISQHILPDRTKTPGVVRADIPLSELCRPGHAKRVRAELSDAEWIQRKREVYARYGIAHHEWGEYEVDHLISIELNGSNAVENLFPQTQRAQWSAAVKDRLENRLTIVNESSMDAAWLLTPLSLDGRCAPCPMTSASTLSPRPSSHGLTALTPCGESCFVGSDFKTSCNQAIAH